MTFWKHARSWDSKWSWGGRNCDDDRGGHGHRSWRDYDRSCDGRDKWKSFDKWKWGCKDDDKPDPEPEPTNTAPEITSPTDGSTSTIIASLGGGELAVATVVATDAENDSLIFSLDPDDDVAYDIDPDTGVITVDSDTFIALTDREVTVTVSDGELTDTISFILEVDVTVG